MILSIETSLGSGSCTAQRSIAIAYIVDTLLFNLDENKINGMDFVVLSMIYPNMSILRSTYLLITPLFWRLPMLLNVYVVV